jgi:glyoxylase-like metal-dependent hydrolase (beta-lactamase superfamily II)
MHHRRSLLAAAFVAPAIPSAMLTPGGQGCFAQSGPAGFHRIQVGSLPVTVVTDGVVRRPDATQGLVVNASPEQVTAAMQAGGLSGPGIDNPYNVTFVQTRRGLVALDAGNGSGANASVGRMVENMRAAGLDPDQVVLVAHTHFHGDHIGGLLTAAGTPLFPKAEVAVPEREWSFWTDAGEESRAAESRRPNFANVRRRFAPYEQKLSRFAPGAEVAPGITAVPTPGHSPGHTSFLVSDGNAQLLVLGDCVTTPVLFVSNPDWYPVFDMDPPLAVETRKRILDRAATERLQVVGYHFPMPATGRVERAGASSYRLVPG